MAERGVTVSDKGIGGWCLKGGWVHTQRIRSCQRRFKGLNHRAENSHQPTRERQRRLRGLKSPGQAPRFFSTFGVIASFFLRAGSCSALGMTVRSCADGSRHGANWSVCNPRDEFNRALGHNMNLAYEPAVILRRPDL